jgi:hypothetical protein
MAIKIGGSIVPDVNLGTAALTIINGELGAIQIDGVLRLNREKYIRGEGLLECLALEDRYLVGFADPGDETTTYQEALGYSPVNFVDPAAILFPV